MERLSREPIPSPFDWWESEHGSPRKASCRGPDRHVRLSLAPHRLLARLTPLFTRAPIGVCYPVRPKPDKLTDMK
jgi:hypothetical protein